MIEVQTFEERWNSMSVELRTKYLNKYNMNPEYATMNVDELENVNQHLVGIMRILFSSSHRSH